MKKILLGALILGTIASCKKDKNDSPSCEKTVAGIANNYKLTAASQSFSNIPNSTTDIYNTILDACTKSGVYQLKSDRTAIFTESGSGCSTSPQTGDWDVVSNKISISTGGVGIEDANVDSWDCTTLVVSNSITSSGVTAVTKYTFTKQ